MTLFIDSANLDDVIKSKDYGCVGATTNPRIWKESGQPYDKAKYHETIKAICDAIDGPVSVELTRTMEDSPALVREAAELWNLDRGRIVVKVPMWASGKGLTVIRDLKKLSIPTNATCLMNAAQGIVACEAGAKYVSLFYRRMVDFYKDDRRVAQEFGSLSRYLCGKTCGIIAGSIREPDDVVRCFDLGADIVTVPAKILWGMSIHQRTESTIEEFNQAWKEYTGG